MILYENISKIKVTPHISKIIKMVIAYFSVLDDSTKVFFRKVSHQLLKEIFRFL